MSFLYFAYGSNLWVPQMRSRCPSATPVETVVLEGWKLVYDKPSTDGSAKLNIRPAPGGSVPGVLYEIEDGERQRLDEAEPGYRPIGVDVGGRRALTYTYEGHPHDRLPYDWYVAVATAGAAQHGLTDRHLRSDVDPDPLAAGIRPASVDDMGLIRSILSSGLRAETGRDYIHPGDYAWWVYHDDPRHPDHFSTWIQGDSGFVIIDSLDPNEINVFTRPGVDRMPLIRWAQRRLDGRGEIGSVADTDEELVSELKRQGYSPVSTYHSYRWDLNADLPQPILPDGWTLRHLRGEEEANDRRAAAHAAFESTMPAAMHLQRYLGFMRSPEYVPERDLVAVDPDGRIASFMVWWADDSGVAQIEPFGTHPDYHRQGIGRALIYHGLLQMKAAGMHTCRVLTDDWRAATAFYEGVGFTDVGRIRT
ncbi:MAG: GNAT family N-acetyltransferase, partial [Acidimicrobiia bacterium]